MSECSCFIEIVKGFGATHATSSIMQEQICPILFIM